MTEGTEFIGSLFAIFKVEFCECPSV
jgi:hypothetical protein